APRSARRASRPRPAPRRWSAPPRAPRGERNRRASRSGSPWWWWIRSRSREWNGWSRGGPPWARRRRSGDRSPRGRGLGFAARAARLVGLALDRLDQGLDDVASLDEGGDAAVVGKREHRLHQGLEERHRLAGEQRERLAHLEREDRGDLEPQLDHAPRQALDQGELLGRERLRGHGWTGCARAPRRRARRSRGETAGTRPDTLPASDGRDKATTGLRPCRARRAAADPMRAARPPRRCARPPRARRGGNAPGRSPPRGC